MEKTRLTVCFLSEVYPPFGGGGAEYSTAAQATGLVMRGVRVIVLTPNWGAAPHETTPDGVEIRRAPWPWRGAKGRPVRPLRLANPLTYAYLAVWIVWQTWRLGADLLHIQTKHMLVPGVVAATLMRRPVVATIRDLGILCHAPVCLLANPHAPESEAQWVARATNNIEMAAVCVRNHGA